MRVEKNPTCRTHPRMRVQYTSSADEDFCRWGCSICSRPLGIASIGACIADARNPPFPRGRKLTPRQAATDAADWEWITRREWEDEDDLQADDDPDEDGR